MYNKKSDVDRILRSSATDNNGMRVEPSDSGMERIYDTKRFMRVDDIEGARPVNKRAIADKDKQLILSNDPRIEQNYHNSQFFVKNKDKQGRLPFTRRVNKGLNKIDKSMVSSIDPGTGEKLANPYMNISMDRPPNQRMKKFKEHLHELTDEFSPQGNLQNLRAGNRKSKRSHKLGLTKEYDPNMSVQKSRQKGGYDQLEMGRYADTQISKADGNNTIDYGTHNVAKPGKSFTGNATPDKMYSKREARLREFNSRSQRKDTTNSKFGSELKNENRTHFKSIDRTMPKGQQNALTMMNISQQLDQRNINRHKGQNMMLDGVPSTFNDTSNILKKQYSSELLPQASMGGQHYTPMNHQRGASKIETGRRLIEKEITKSNFMNGLSSNDFVASKVNVNPITGQMSPVMNKAKIF